MTAIRVADLFASVGMRFDPKALNDLQRRLGHVKKQFLSLQHVARFAFSGPEQIRALRAVNSQLTRTAGLVKQISASGPIRIRQSGGRRGNVGHGMGGGSAFGGVVSGFGAGRVPVFARNFFAGFTGAIAIRQLYEAQVAMDTIRVGIKATLRPTEKLGEVMDFLRNSAQQLGFEFKTSAIQYTQFAASAKAANISIADTRKVFIAAQTASRVFHLSVDDTAGVIKAFTQILSKGKIQAEELRNQLGDRLPAAVPLMAKALGVTTQQLNKMLQQGQILANDAVPKLADTIIDQYGGAVEEASHTAQAGLNRFLNAWFFFKAEISASGIDSVFGLALAGAGEALNQILPLVQFLARAIRTLITPIHALFRIVDRVNGVFSGFSLHLILAISGVQLLRMALVKLNIQTLIAAARWALVAAAIAFVLILIDDLATALEGGKSVIGDWSESGNPLLEFVSKLALAVGGLVKFVSELVAWLSTGAENLDLIADRAREFGNRIHELIDALGKLFNMLSFGKLGELGSWLGVTTQHFVQGLTPTSPGFNQDVIQGNRSNKQVNIQGSPVNITVPAGSDEAFIDRVKSAIEDANDSMLRQAQSQFGALE